MSPGECVGCVCTGPEASMAIGVFHQTDAFAVPCSFNEKMSDGQLRIIGGEVSTAREEETICRELDKIYFLSMRIT